MFGRLPAHGLYVRHAERIRIRDAEFLTVGRDGRPAVACDDVNDLVLSGLEASCPTSERPVVMMRDVRRVFLHGCRAPQGCT